AFRVEREQDLVKKTLDRKTVYTDFALQWPRLGRFSSVQLAPRGTGFVATYASQTTRGLCLARSSDFWHYRLHLARSPLDLVVCYRHDTILPITVVEIETGKHYTPHEYPNQFTSYEEAYQARTQAGRLTIVGGLLCGVQRAYDLVAALPESTRRKYENSAHDFQKRRPGRQLASTSPTT
ncbi:MAG TPA: hypothetical protein VEL69_04850, partial [Ktedonobacteraceae bacterium]|nr:hypothetical protein [Ktedonobacteraceae bacterium]